MAYRKIERLGLNTDMVEKFKQCGITDARAFLELSILDIIMIGGINHEDGMSLIYKVSQLVCPRSYRALSLHVKNKNICCGVDMIDSFSGGLILGSITEVCGLPGMGKSQLCMTCCAQFLSQLFEKNQNGNIVYIDTELKFCSSRLLEILVSKYPQLQSVGCDFTALLERVKVYRPMTCKELLGHVDSLQESVLLDNTKLIVVDSIASLARKEGLQEGDKETYLAGQASLLKRLAEAGDVCVLACNQIASIHSSSYLDGGGDRTLTHRSDTIYDSSGKAYVPALGPLWHHCVTTRYVLQEGDPRTVAPPRADTDTARVRSIRLIKSPLVDAWVCRYTICKSGVTSVVPDYDRPVTS